MKKKLCSLLLVFAMTLGLLPCAALAADSIPFSASADQTVLTAGKSDQNYTYTVVTEYDESWNPVQTEERTAPLYYVVAPDTEWDTLTLDFGGETRLAYGYDTSGNYVASYAPDGTYESNGQFGATTAIIPGSLPDFVRVQLPYESGGDLLYAITFQVEDTPPETPDHYTVSADTILAAMASAHTESVSSWWWAAGMSAYAAYQPDTTFLPTAAAKQTFVDSTAASIAADPTNSNKLANAINGLTALGYDPTNITAADGSKLNAVQLLSQVDTQAEQSTTWAYYTVPPYVLLACNQGGYATDTLENAAIEFLLAHDEDAGGWSTGWGADTTAMVLQGLAPYYLSDPQVTEAVDKAITVLSAQQDSETGGYGNAATEACVILALTGLGIDPDNDLRFIKNGISAADSLLSRYVDGTFGGDYNDSQSFLAVTAIAQMEAGADSCNVFDFSALPKVPAVATPAEDGSGDTPPIVTPPLDQITVSFALKTHQSTWISAHNVTVEVGSTVADVFFQVLDARDDISYEFDGGYIRSITKSGTTWGEFDAGPRSGWKYMVNGAAPGVGMTARTLEDGDRLVWYYVTDYTEDPVPDEKPTVTPAEKPILPVPVPNPDLNATADFSDVSGHWAQNAIQYCYARGLMSGTGDSAFSPDVPLNRAMLVTMLYSLESKPDTAPGASFADVSPDAWYASAVAWAVEQGLLSGYPDGTIGPEDNITREQLAAILWRYAQLKQLDVSGTASLNYTDSAAVSDWAAPALQWACGAGLMDGYNNALMPRGEATRGQMATILMNYLEMTA